MKYELYQYDDMFSNICLKGHILVDLSIFIRQASHFQFEPLASVQILKFIVFAIVNCMYVG